MLNRKIEPPFHEATDFNFALKPYEHYTLANQVPVYSLDTGAEEVAMVEFVFYAGNWFETQKIEASATNFLLKNGTHHQTAFQIDEAFEFYGAYLSRSCHNETATVTLHCLAKHLSILLPKVAELFTESNFPESEFDIFKQNAKQRLHVNLLKNDFNANRLIDQYVYGIQHPYGVYSNAADYDALNLDQIKKYYQQYYTHGNCMIFTAGKLPKDLPQLLETHFGELPFHVSKDPWKKIQHTITPDPEKIHNVIIDEKGVQGALRIAKPFIDRQHPDFLKVQVLNTIFGGYFGSRLMSNIREEKGYTYGIYSYFQNHLTASAWGIATEVRRDACEDAIKEIWKEANLLRQEIVSEEELYLVKNYMLGSLLSDLDGPFQIIARWKAYIISDLDENYFKKSIETIKNITAQEIQELANKYLTEKDFYQLTVI